MVGGCRLPNTSKTGCHIPTRHIRRQNLYQTLADQSMDSGHVLVHCLTEYSVLVARQLLPLCAAISSACGASVCRLPSPRLPQVVMH